MRVHWSTVQVHNYHHQPATVLTQQPVFSVRETPPLSLSAALEIFVLLVERGRVRAEWRSVWRDSGGLCVTCTISGGRKRQQLYAGNWT